MSHNKLDLTGQEFGRLVAEEDSGERYEDRSRHKAGAVLWVCRCDPRLGGCGARVLVATHNLRSGNTRSCGCLHVDVSVARRTGRRPLPLVRAVRVDGEALAARRLDAGLSQESLAATVGFRNPSHIRWYEVGVSKHAHPRTVARIAAVLGCSPDDLSLSDTAEPKRARPTQQEFS